MVVLEFEESFYVQELFCVLQLSSQLHPFALAEASEPFSEVACVTIV